MVSSVRMVMFDLSGTTVADDTGVRDCLYQAALEHDLHTTPDEILYYMGTNKIHLYQFLIARQEGQQVSLQDFEQLHDPDTRGRALQIFNRYQTLMVEHYQDHVQEVPGATDVFRWCHDRGIKVATDTGFHKVIVEAIMDALGWLQEGLVDLAVDVEDIPGQVGRPAPFMIFHAMQQLNIQSVHQVIKVGDTPADMLEGRNAGVRGVVGVLSGPRPVSDWGKFWHTHVIDSVADLPDLISREFDSSACTL